MSVAPRMCARLRMGEGQKRDDSHSGLEAGVLQSSRVRAAWSRRPHGPVWRPRRVDQVDDEVDPVDLAGTARIHALGDLFPRSDGEARVRAVPKQDRRRRGRRRFRAAGNGRFALDGACRVRKSIRWFGERLGAGSQP